MATGLQRIWTATRMLLGVLAIFFAFFLGVMWGKFQERLHSTCVRDWHCPDGSTYRGTHLPGGCFSD